MTTRSVPTRTLSDRPNLDQLKRQAKELREAFRKGNAAAANEVHAHYRGASPSSFELHDAQLVLARAYGFDSWPKLRAFVNGATVRQLVDAIRAGDFAAVQKMIDARPELVHMDVAENDEHRALHHAVLRRRPEIVRFLMQHGADARKGIWPHRDATSAFTLAVERDYQDIVRIIVEEEDRRRSESLQKVTVQPSLKAESMKVSPGDGAVETAYAAIARGDVSWVQARAREGLIVDGARLVSHAVAADRPEMLALLLQLGLDPDESGRVEGLEEVVPTWGGPLRACAISGKLAMAEMLLAHGAKANTNVYAASSALFEAYKRRDGQLIALLESHGGRLNPVGVAELGLVEHAAKWLADESDARTSGAVFHEANVAWNLLWGAMACPEIVQLVLQVVDWPREDPRWHGILENGLYLGPESDRPRHLEAFRLVLDRSDPDVRSRRGTTILHEIAASRGGLRANDRSAYTALLLDRGARLDIRDELLESTPLGWACRWGRVEMVQLLIARGADAVEADALPWASPMAWAKSKGRQEVVALLEKSGATRVR